MAKVKKNGYYPRSRGIMDYISIYSDAAWKMHDYFLAKAQWKKAGKDYGTYEFKLSDLANRLGKHPHTAKRCIRELHFGYIHDDPPAPPFIRVIKVSGKTNNQTIKIKLLKPKLKPADFKKDWKRTDSYKIPKNANTETVKYVRRMIAKHRDKRKLPEPEGKE